jgi:hypothetical protein
MVNRLPHHISGFHRRTLVVTVALVASFGVLSAPPSVLAVEHHPTGAFAPFADCPLSNASVEECIVAHTSAGEFVVGKKTVPIRNTITLQGGTIENLKTGELTFVGAEDGNTLSKTPQPVPGGLLGLINCNEIKGEGFLEKLARGTCEAIFENKTTGVTATTELAAPASQIGISTTNLLFGEGVALSLPVKVKLDNPLLGASCYIGSNAKPVVIELTTGTTNPPPPNKPIKGSPGELEIKEEGSLVIVKNNSLVNNSFAAPKSEGCGGLLSFLIGPIIDAKLGLPAAAGLNTAILKGTLEQAAAASVRKSEK